MQLVLLRRRINHYIGAMTGEWIIFGLICAALLALAVLAMFGPMWRTRLKDAEGKVDTDIDIYRDQLREVDRDLERGVLDEAEAARTRTEISRRLLAADAGARSEAQDAPRTASRTVAAVLSIGLIGAAAGLYFSLGAFGYGDVPRAVRLAASEERRAERPLQLEAEAANPILDAITQAEPETAEILQALRGATFERPDDIQGWAYLAQVEASIGNMQRAARAQERTISMLGDTATNEDYVRLLDFLVIGTRGYVSPEAETIALTILRRDPTNLPALYYAGLMYAQNDRPDRAFDLWRRVVEGGDQSIFHWRLAASQIEDVAAQLAIDYALPDQRGPSAEDLEAAEDMAPEDRQAMIQGMVSQLADRLATEGGPPQDWARLISSLMVLGEEDTARTILAEAELAFGGDVQAVGIVRAAAREAGLIE
ncbi:c-type cytochrome biogenesis protein CcmI [Octadecabacter sp. CECT 8868]|uniref:c-type cytochrome biogenesis protein CcmI n=1 Tax=Octadecabacter algicola TaxID=2909342 RepID=UPI001F17D692|nr:c-type cytochrome biogenesis protein CcmI [Octadecabacter algicola]MCF2904192.1 c-type cytochrome biogenesis protein CcmI [Octadecabacter algicola]